MSNNPFSSKPTIVDEVEQDDEDTTEDDGIPKSSKVQEDYDEVDTMGVEVEDDDGEADEEWAQTPTTLFARLDQEKFWWVFITLKQDFVESGEQRRIPVVQERFDSYDDLVDARENTDEEIPEGIHVQLRSSDKVRYVKGDDEQNLLEWRDLA